MTARGGVRGATGWAIAAASAAILGTALASQYWGGLHPCLLCLYQRIPYAATIVLGLVGAWLAGTGRFGLAAVALAACAAVFAAGAGVAAFHVGVEQHWWPGTTACTGAASGTATTVEALRQQILDAPVVRCDDVQWSLLGISMAGYNVLASVALAALALAAARGVAAQAHP